MSHYVIMLQTDNDDQYLTESTLSELSNPVQVQFVSTPSELDDVVKVSGLPSLILINDHGAIHHGPTLVKQVKSKPQYAHIPIVILGEVTTPDYVRQCYRAGANTFITKPSTIAGTKKKIESFFNYWFEVAETA